MKTNALYYGDNLDILRRHIPDGSIDLIYLDPPFNSRADYNVLFREPTGEASAAQLRAFTDTWHWDPDLNGPTECAYSEIMRTAPLKVQKAVEALRAFIGSNDVMAYLVMMTARLVEMHRVLRPTGSLYLHCDPTASHYLKVVLDTIFGPRSFRNEIIWQRTTSHTTTSRRFGRVTDTILFFTKTNSYTYTSPRASHDDRYVERFYRFQDPDGRRYRTHLVERNQALGIRPNLIYEYRGYTPPYGWMMEQEKLEELDKQGKLGWSTRGRPYRKIYLDEVQQPPISNLWGDIPPVQAQAKERLGYETQKPLALLERIISASSNQGDIVLDPFCGCGTAIVAAHKLGRRWVGIDVTHLAITVMKNRLKGSSGLEPGRDYAVIGEPVDLAGARALALARQGRYQFQYWAVGRLEAHPVGDDRKKGADRGVDGIITFMGFGGKVRRIIVQVKSGHVTAAQVRDLKGTMEREKAEMGLFLTLEPPTQPMRTEAAEAGFYHYEQLNKDFPRIQICTIEELLEGKQPQLPPPGHRPLRPGPQVRRREGKQGELLK